MPQPGEYFTHSFFNPQTEMKKKILFSLTTILSLLIILEVCLRIFFPDPKMKLFVSTDRDRRYYSTNSYFLQREYKNASFEMPKPPGHIRVFCLGGSTTAGYYPDLMGKMILQLSPFQRFEIINCGRHSLGITDVTDCLEELVAYEPDAFVLYSGHNEFMINNLSRTRQVLGHPFLFQVRRGLEHIHLYRTWKRLLMRLKQEKGRSVFYTLPMEIQALPDIPGKPIFSREDYRMVLENYRVNLEKIIALSRKYGVKLIVSNLVSNLRDFNPSVSFLTCPLDASARRHWRQYYFRGKDLYAEGALQEALEQLEKAAAICDSFADLHYLMGKIYDRFQHYEKAEEAYKKARDLDGIPFRTTSRLNALVAEICEKENVPLIDSITSFKIHSPGQLIGKNLIVDNVHPSPEGAFLISAGFCRALEEVFADMLQRGFQWPERWDSPAELLQMNRTMRADYYLYLARYTAQLAALTREKKPRLMLAGEYLEEAGKFGAPPVRIAKISRYLALIEKDTARAIREEYPHSESLKEGSSVYKPSF